MGLVGFGSLDGWPKADPAAREAWAKGASKTNSTTSSSCANSSCFGTPRPPAASSCRPSCLTAAATQAPIDCAVASNSRARSPGDRPARTKSIIWRRNSGEYGGRVLGIRNTSAESFRVSTTRVNPTMKTPGQFSAKKSTGEAAGSTWALHECSFSRGQFHTAKATGTLHSGIGRCRDSWRAIFWKTGAGCCGLVARTRGQPTSPIATSVGLTKQLL